MFNRIFGSSRPTVAVIRLEGPISSAGPRAGLTDHGLAAQIEKAFRRGKPAAVALAINCPGGSAAQSSLIAARIRRLSEEKRVPVFAFCEDVAASGGYWLACAADEIFVDETSMVGSIGVISASFGFNELIARHGVERRVHTAGESKSLLDPFRPERPQDVERLETWLGQLHEAFIAHVKSRRGPKLDASENLFTGNIWIGHRAIEKGLADGVGHLVPEMKRRFGPKTRFRNYGQKKSLMARLGATAAAGALESVESRLAFGRFGL
ncbi:S49 family peptidase [Pseudoroseicyclus tamaricis]|uniref:S49 family peptidase n=1 Tax=Pseudoroseicyclus tamaricis TaxID=2705421 RepID=A0A6B2JL83_9RHOB|nr:S49 family peptidase [Pseudoroseicyclus tamaricis]NDV02311.1 S49 family peptidase [Pseudoroseicyclus tamaricis]